MAKKTLSDRRAEKLSQLEALKKEIADLESKAAERIGRIAVKAGIGDLEISDADLAKEFAAVVSKFRNNQAQ